MYKRGANSKWPRFSFPGTPLQSLSHTRIPGEGLGICLESWTAFLNSQLSTQVSFESTFETTTAVYKVEQKEFIPRTIKQTFDNKDSRKHQTSPTQNQVSCRVTSPKNKHDECERWAARALAQRSFKREGPAMPKVPSPLSLRLVPGTSDSVRRSADPRHWTGA